MQNGQGAALLAWENEAYLPIEERPGEFEIVTPPTSILAEPPVTVADKRGTREVATEFLNRIYTDEGQRIAGKHCCRPSNPDILKEFGEQCDLSAKLITIDDPLFGGWLAAHKKHLSDGGIFDQIFTK